MNVTDAILNRRSTRAFKPDPVPQETIREVIEIARHAPSAGNSQPWHVAVVSGAARDRLEAAIFDEIQQGKKPYPTFPAGGRGLTGVHKERQVHCGYTYYGTMGIERSDKDARRALGQRNWNFFDAPHALFLSMPEYMERLNALDVGIFLQSIALLFTERGISCIPQGALASYPGPVRAVADIPEGNAILCGISFGYADESARANSFKMDRAPLDEIASFAT